MKFIVAFIAIVAVAVAVPLKPASNELAEMEAIIAAIHSPSTDPATAALLEEQLVTIINALAPISVGPAIIETSPIAVGPAIIESSPISVGPAIIETSPIAVGPAIIDFPLPDGGVVTADESALVPAPIVAPTPVVTPSPVVVGEIPTGSSPLVQIIVNVNQAESGVVTPAPVVVPEAVVVPAPAAVEEVYVPGPVNVVEDVDVVLAPVMPIQVVEEVYQPGPVNVVESVDVPVVEPIAIGTPVLPVVVEPVIIGTPIIPVPAVVLPETLN